MNTPLESALAHTLHAAARAAPEPPPDLFEGVNGLLKRHRQQRRLAVAGAAAAVAVVTIGAVTLIAAVSPHEGGVGTTPATAATDDELYPTAKPPRVRTDGCTVRELPLPPSWSGEQPGPEPVPDPGRQQRAVAGNVDPSGRYVTGYVDGEQGSWALLWVDGEVRVLDTTEGSYASGVNATGTVIGYNKAGGWVYRDGQRTKLPRLPGSAVAAPIAINSRGDIVGISGGRTVIWPGDQPGQVRPIGDVSPEITSVSDDGLMVEHVDPFTNRLRNRDGTIHPHPSGFRPELVAGVWVLGELDRSTPPGWPSPTPTTLASGPGGVVVDGGRWALWNLTTDAMIPLSVDGTGAYGFQPNEVSESGAVLATVWMSPDRSDRRHAVLRDGELILLPLPKRPSDMEARAISDDGRTIVGTDRRALLWRC